MKYHEHLHVFLMIATSTYGKKNNKKLEGNGNSRQINQQYPWNKIQLGGGHPTNFNLLYGMKLVMAPMEGRDCCHFLRIVFPHLPGEGC